MEPLDRSAEQYSWVLRTWLTTPNLTPNEIALIKVLQEGLEKSMNDFDQLRRIAVQPAFITHLKSSAAKAIAAGKLKSWSEYDPQT
ncbi:hypothetical protein [Rhizobium arsenicireducens]